MSSIVVRYNKNEINISVKNILETLKCIEISKYIEFIVLIHNIKHV